MSTSMLSSLLENGNKEHNMNSKNQDEEVRGNVSVSYHCAPQESAARAQYRKIEDAQHSVLVLESYQSLVQYVETDGEYILSAGREYGIDVWDASIGTLKRSLTGHSGPVRGIALLSSYRSQELARKLGYRVSERIVVSASEDQTLRLWSLHRGEQLRCFKTGSIITCFGIMNQVLAVTGNRGGELVVCHLGAGNKMLTIQAHSDPIDAIAVESLYVCTAIFKPYTRIKVWQLQHGKLTCMYSSVEALDILMEPMEACALAYFDGVVILGNNQEPLLHFINWKTNHRARLRTGGSSSERLVGCVNQIRVKDDLLMTSSSPMFPAVGKAIVDIYLIPDYEHLCTFDLKINQVMALTYAKSENNIKFVFGGTALLILDLLLPPEENKYQLPALRVEGGRNIPLTRSLYSNHLPLTTNNEERKSEMTEEIVQITEDMEVIEYEANAECKDPQEEEREENNSSNEEEEEEMENYSSKAMIEHDSKSENGSTGFVVSSEIKNGTKKDLLFSHSFCSSRSSLEGSDEFQSATDSPHQNKSNAQKAWMKDYNILSQFEKRCQESKENDGTEKMESEENTLKEGEIMKNSNICLEKSFREDFTISNTEITPKDEGLNLKHKKGVLTNPKIELFLENSGFIKEKEVESDEDSSYGELSSRLSKIKRNDTFSRYLEEESKNLNECTENVEDLPYSMECSIRDVEQMSLKASSTTPASKFKSGNHYRKSQKQDYQSVSDSKHPKGKLKLCNIM